MQWKNVQCTQAFCEVSAINAHDSLEIKILYLEEKQKCAVRYFKIVHPSTTFHFRDPFLLVLNFLLIASRPFPFHKMFTLIYSTRLSNEKKAAK